MRMLLSLTTSAAFRIAAAATLERLPAEPKPVYGVWDVSPHTTRTSLKSTPNWSAATCASVVSVPWPSGIMPV